MTTNAKKTKTKRRTPVCASCTAAVLDEPGGHRMAWDDAEDLARELGADIADHICDARDEGLPCGCACRLYGSE